MKKIFDYENIEKLPSKVKLNFGRFQYCQKPAQFLFHKNGSKMAQKWLTALLIYNDFAYDILLDGYHEFF